MCPDVMRRGDADALRTEVDRLGQHFARHHAVLDDLLVVVKVVDKHVERLYPLLESGVGLLPFGQRDDARHDVEGPGPVDHVAFGVDSEGDAHQLDGNFGRRLVFAQLAGIEVGEVLAQQFRLRSRLPWCLYQFIVEAFGCVIVPVYFAHSATLSARGRDTLQLAIAIPDAPDQGMRRWVHSNNCHPTVLTK